MMPKIAAGSDLREPVDVVIGISDLRLTGDLNGNMLSDGANTFTWNARNQVAALNSVSLQYDGFGRRTKNLQNTSFLFGGSNAVQELSGSTVLASLLNGGLDEVFTRSDSSGTFTQLKDALGSTIALVDASGNLVTQYAYDPLGNTIVSGAMSSNGFQYTGRENEGNGLYFYRARYYSPLLGRFINEDPIGIEGGLNTYSYAFNSPTNLIDPSGNCPILCEPPPVLPAGGAGAATGGAVGTLVAAGEGSTPVLTLVAGGSAEGSGGGPIGALSGIIGAVGTYDAVQGYKLGQAYGWWGQPDLAGRACKKPDTPPAPAMTIAPWKADPPLFKRTDRCEKVHEDCIDACIGELGKGGRTTQGFPFFNCVNRCMEDAGCL